MNRKIYIPHFKNFDFEILNDPYFEICNLQGNKINTKFEYFINHDNDQILSNQNLSELTILYNAWKFKKFSKMFGLFHYRRFLLLQNVPTNLINSRVIWQGHLMADWKKRSNFAKHNIKDILKFDDTLFVPLIRHVSDFNSQSLYHDFLGAHPELEEILNRTFIIHEKLTKDHSFRSRMMESKEMVHFNIFYGPGSFAYNLSEYMFPTLEQIGSEFKNNFEGENLRWAGFIGERIFSHFVQKTKEEKKIQIIHKPVVYFDDLQEDRFKKINSAISKFKSKFNLLLN